MRLVAILPWVSVLASGCVSASWSIDRNGARPLTAIAVARVEVQGDADPKLMLMRRAALVDSLRARGYDVQEARPGVPLLKITVGGKTITDAQMHAPDDRAHNIENDLHYRFVAYHVDVELVDGANIVAMGSADSNEDPAPALRVLSDKLFTDTPPGLGNTLASR